jgi:hypothetical protein
LKGRLTRFDCGKEWVDGARAGHPTLALHHQPSLVYSAAERPRRRSGAARRRRDAAAERRGGGAAGGNLDRDPPRPPVLTPPMSLSGTEWHRLLNQARFGGQPVRKMAGTWVKHCIGYRRQEKLPAKSIWRATFCRTRFPTVACAEEASCPPSDARVWVEEFVMGWNPIVGGRTRIQRAGNAGNEWVAQRHFPASTFDPAPQCDLGLEWSRAKSNLVETWKWVSQFFPPFPPFSTISTNFHYFHHFHHFHHFA